MSGFQKTVNLTPAPAVAGDFASSNPRATVLAGPGGLVAGLGGVTVGKFAWVDTDGVTVLSHGTAAKSPSGFVHREQQALIQTYLAESGMNIPQGFPVTLHNQGDFWAVNGGAGAFAVGDSVYANCADGTVAQSAATNATATASMGATFTASGSGTNLTVSAVTGLISIGETLGTTTGIPAGTTIVSQTSGTTGGAGVYVTSVATTISAATATSFGNVLNVTAVASGSLDIGESVTGTGIPAGAVLDSQISGASGGVGVYALSVPATAYAASTTVTSVGGVAATGWKAQSAAAVGELVKISTWG